MKIKGESQQKNPIVSIPSIPLTGCQKWVQSLRISHLWLKSSSSWRTLHPFLLKQKSPSKNEAAQKTCFTSPIFCAPFKHITGLHLPASHLPGWAARRAPWPRAAPPRHSPPGRPGPKAPQPSAGAGTAGPPHGSPGCCRV